MQRKMSEPNVLPAPAVEGNSTHGQLTEAAQGASLETVLLEGAPALVAPLGEGAGGHCPEKNLSSPALRFCGQREAR